MKQEDGILALFSKLKPVIGMIHLKGNDAADIMNRAKREIDIYIKNGIDGLMLENYYGTYSDLERSLQYAEQAGLGIPYGVNCLNVDALGFELAQVYGASYIQVDSVVGHVAPRDEESLERFFAVYRKRYPAYLIGGVRFKYQPVFSEKSEEEDLLIGKSRCDAIAVTGEATGEETSIDKIRRFRAGLGDFPLVIAAGLTAENAAEQLEVGDMAIVGSFFKDNYRDDGDVCAEHIKRFMDEVERLRRR